MSFSIKDRLPAYTRLPLELPPPNYNPEEAIAAVNALTPSQRASLASGIAIAASSKEGAAEFKAASRSAATAALAIETLFITITARINALDGGTQTLVEEFTTIKGDYRVAVETSNAAAVKISQYAASFDEIIVKFTSDKTISVEERIKRIDTYIEDSVRIKESAQGLELEFSKFTAKFDDFVSSFSSWAEKQEAADKDKITEIRKEIHRLDVLIGKLDTAMAALGSTLAATLSVAGLAVAAIPIAAPWITFWAAFAVNIQATAIIAVLVARVSAADKKRIEEKKIVELEDNISKIQGTRARLEEDGQTYLSTFSTHIVAMQGIWAKVVDDARQIKVWLQEGADEANQPEYMRLALREGVRVYRAMGDYLKDYADGVTLG